MNMGIQGENTFAVVQLDQEALLAGSSACTERDDVQRQLHAERRAHEAGADGLLLKPFNTLTLCEKIDEVLTAQSPPGSSDVGGPENNR